MEFFRDTQIDFMKYRMYFIVVSAVLLLVTLLAVFVHGRLNLGIDFVGGTQVTIKFHQPPEIDELRELMAADPVGGLERHQATPGRQVEDAADLVHRDQRRADHREQHQRRLDRRQVRREVGDNRRNGDW